MSPVERLEGDPVASPITEAVIPRVQRLDDRGDVPTLGTVLASDDPADERFMALKHDAAAAAGIATRDVRLAPPTTSSAIERAVERLSADPAIHAIFVQAPLPAQTDTSAVRQRLDPRKDVDCYHPDSLGRLVAGHPRFVPATPAAVLRMLDHYGIPTAGRDVVLVGRSAVIGRPLANLLWQRGASGDATVTVCHSRTRDLAARTRRADIVVTAAGQPGLVDGSMLADGAVVVDVSANRRRVDGTVEVVGDVDAESAASIASAITPVPGGVGPVTIAMLLENVVLAAERQSGVEPDDDADT